MNKRKILTLALTLSMVAILAIGGTLAYFTDTEAAKNVFTVGDIDIVLNEDFDDENPLVPTDNPEENGVKKVVTIGNEGDSDAYVRLLIAYEDTQDVGAMAWMGFKPNYGLKPFPKADTVDRYSIPSAGNDWLQIKDTKTGTVYTVGCVTLSEALEPGETSEDILRSVAIKGGADNAWAEIVGDEYTVMVLAQGAQVIDDKNAIDSINTAFGFILDNTADEKVAKLFTDAGFGNFEKHDYTAVDAWVPSDAWAAVEKDSTPNPDEVGSITDSNDVAVNP